MREKCSGSTSWYSCLTSVLRLPTYRCATELPSAEFRAAEATTAVLILKLLLLRQTLASETFERTLVWSRGRMLPVDFFQTEEPCSGEHQCSLHWCCVWSQLLQNSDYWACRVSTVSKFLQLEWPCRCKGVRQALQIRVNLVTLVYRGSTPQVSPVYFSQSFNYFLNSVGVVTREKTKVDMSLTCCYIVIFLTPSLLSVAYLKMLIFLTFSYISCFCGRSSKRCSQGNWPCCPL